MAETIAANQQDIAADILAELGDTGLRRFSGTISEEFLSQLIGTKGQRVYMEMRDNHPVVGATLFAIRMLMRQVPWRIEAASDKSEDRATAGFLQECMDDMSSSWDDTIAEIFTFLEYGFAFHEIVYKERRGPDQEDPTKRSRYKDGKYGWRKIAGRSQDTLLRWIIDEDGGVRGFVQQPWTGGIRIIPIERGLLFRASTAKNNPEGRSILRNAAVPYLFQKKLLEVEAIGAERDLAGLPVARVPSAYMSRSATPEQQVVYGIMKGIVRSVKRDEGEGIVLPSDMDKNGKPLFDLQLMSSGGSRQFDVDKIIQRYDQRIAMTMLADFILLGHEKVGSFALSSDKTDIFATAIGSFLDSVCDIFNRHAIPRLLKLNGMKVNATPILTHGDIEKPNLAELGAYIQSLSAAGMPLFPDPATEKYLRDAANLPEPDPSATPEAGTGAGKTEAKPTDDKPEPIAAPGTARPNPKE
jgi:hypothetical protein